MPKELFSYFSRTESDHVPGIVYDVQPESGDNCLCENTATAMNYFNVRLRLQRLSGYTVSRFFDETTTYHVNSALQKISDTYMYHPVRYQAWKVRRTPQVVGTVIKELLDQGHLPELGVMPRKWLRNIFNARLSPTNQEIHSILIHGYSLNNGKLNLCIVDPYQAPATFLRRPFEWVFPHLEPSCRDTGYVLGAFYQNARCTKTLINSDRYKVLTM